MDAIPAIDLLDGRCVRLLQGDFRKLTVYDDDPVRLAREWAAAGARRLHVVDLDAARGVGGNRDTVARIVREGGVEVQVAGGIRDADAVAAWLALGAAAVVMGTTAVRDPAALAEAAGSHPGRVLAALDLRAGRPAVAGWVATEDTGVARLVEAWNAVPLAGVVLTSIDRDGTMAGIDSEMLATVVAQSRHPVTYSGGVADVQDVGQARRLGASAVIIGRALYEGRIGVGEAVAAAGR